MINFNGVDLSTLFQIDNVKRPIITPLSTISVNVPGMNGAHFVRNELQALTIDVDVFIVGESLGDIRTKVQNIASKLFTQEPAPLVFNDQPNQTYHAVVTGNTDLEQIMLYGNGTIKFYLPDPLAYGPETSLAFSNDSVSPNVEGTYKTLPRINATFTAAASEFKVTHNGLNKYVRVIRNFVVGDVLELEFATGKITLNGIVTMPILDWANSEFFELTPGIQTLTVTPASAANTTIYWKPRWL